MQAQYQETLQQRLSTGRRNAFVGRDAEMQAFETMLSPDSSTRLWFVVGPGGVGKTTLLHAFCEYARQRNNPVVFVDARSVKPNPPAARHALEQAAGNRPLSDFCNSHAAPLLVVDTFEQWQALELWLRETFLADVPANLRVIIAARRPPAPDWQADAGWRSLMQVTTLTDLAPGEAAVYLEFRGVDALSRDVLITLSGGRPLVLALGADMAVESGGLQSADDTHAIIEKLVTHFTDVADCPAQREALDAAAIVREINEGLLARMLGMDDAGALYEWLSGLSFMGQGRYGLFPHDLVRRTLIQDMPRRFPGRYEAHVQRAFGWNVDEIEAAGNLSWTEAARFAGDGLYALRQLDVVQHFLEPRGAQSLYIERAAKQDWPILADMVARQEGLQSRAWFEFWCQRAPDSVFVVRDPGATARGLFMKLDMERLEAGDRGADPLTDHLWQRISHDFEIRPDDHIPFIRFWTTRDHGQSQSAEKTVILSAINSYNLKAPNLRLTAQVFSDLPEWVIQARALGIHHLQGSETPIGDHVWCIYYNDWRLESPIHYYRHFAERCINFETVVNGTQMADTGEALTTALGQAVFEDAVVDALKGYHSDTSLKSNPLLGCALVLEATDRGGDDISRVRILRNRLTEGVNTLTEAGLVSHSQRRMLEQAYFKGEFSQKQAAAALQLGYSTFRRQLAEARQALVQELWQCELRQRRYQ